MRRSSIPYIIAANALVFLYWSVNPEFMIQNFLVSWDALAEGRYWVLLSSAFSHNMFFHLFLNMSVLLSFGPTVEESMGTRRFLNFYLLAGIAGSLGHAAITAMMGEPGVPALGASGAISGVVLFFSLLYPRSKIFLLFIPMPALWGAIVMVGVDIWGIIAQAQGGGLPIGHGAHLGGALIGFIYYLLMRSKARS